ncbi:MAG: mechanosensitive ion channel [Ruminococcaceae bacterium]|nr:mechanosensitive ion channel [Oscillospiraceae bacterium]
MENILITIKSFLATGFVSICSKILVTALILIVGLWIVKVVMKKFKKGKLIAKVNPAARGFFCSALDVVLKGVIIISACTYVGIPMASVVAVLGSAGVAIGLALQGGLSNIAGGVMLIVTRPFDIGDYVEVAGVGGTVKAIGIYYTTLDTPDNKKTIIPNGSVTSSPIINYTTNGTRRLDLEFGVAYNADIDLVKKTLLEVATKHELVFKDPAPEVFMTEHADSAVKFCLRVWMNGADYWTVKADCTEGAKRAFDREGIEIPFPQLDVHLDK